MMIRWRTCLVLAVLLLLPRTSGKVDEDDDDDSKQRDYGRSDDAEEEDNEDEDDEDDDAEKPDSAGRRAPSLLQSPPTRATHVTKKIPLECYVCAFKSSTPMRSCLDPVKYRVHSVTCHNADDKCYTSVISKDKSYDAVVRGCRADCVSSTDTRCCEVNRCNNHAYAMPLSPAKLVAAPTTQKATKSPPPSVLFFVTILLLLQTVVKVTFV